MFALSGVQGSYSFCYQVLYQGQATLHLEFAVLLRASGLHVPSVCSRFFGVLCAAFTAQVLIVRHCTFRKSGTANRRTAGFHVVNVWLLLSYWTGCYWAHAAVVYTAVVSDTA